MSNKPSSSLDAPRVDKKLLKAALAPKSPTNTAVSPAALARAVPVPGQVEPGQPAARRIPRFATVLPRWDTTKPVLEDTVPRDPTFNGDPTPLHAVNLREMIDRINALKSTFPGQLDHITPDRPVETAFGQDTDEPLRKAPHPDSDFSHVDPGVFNPSERQRILDAIDDVESVEGLVSRDGELARNIGQGITSLAKARALLAANPRGMQRLAFVFEWTLCQATAIFGELNAALAASDQTAYNAAHDKYLALLDDLDDHEPHTHGPPTPGERGYGITIKHADILPLIFEGKIKGASIVVKWNPHESSSGIPIPHK